MVHAANVKWPLAMILSRDAARCLRSYFAAMRRRNIHLALTSVVHVVAYSVADQEMMHLHQNEW